MSSETPFKSLNRSYIGTNWFVILLQINGKNMLFYQPAHSNTRYYYSCYLIIEGKKCKTENTLFSPAEEILFYEPELLKIMKMKKKNNISYFIRRMDREQERTID